MSQAPSARAVRKALAPALFDAAQLARDAVLFVGLVGCGLLILLALLSGAPS